MRENLQKLVVRIKHVLFKSYIISIFQKVVIFFRNIGIDVHAHSATIFYKAGEATSKHIETSTTEISQTKVEG